MNGDGRLKIFLGYAARVGKSVRMFEEGQRRRARGQDVVIGAVQCRGSADLESIIREFEVIPLAGDSVDVPAILQRRPEVCLVDELGNHNRWREVEQLCHAGINVVTAVNLQYISPECVPEHFIHTADELVIVDAASGHRDEREQALLLAAQVVEEQLNRYMEHHGISHNWGTQERILVCITARSNTRPMLERAARTAAAFHGHLLALHVGDPSSGAVTANLDLARELGAEVHVIDAMDPIATMIRFAREQRVTQVFIGHTQQPRWKFWSTSGASRLIREAEGMDVRLFPAA